MTGPPGSGKSAVLIALADALTDDRVAHATVDVDEVAWAWPYPEANERIELMRALWEAHRAAGHELLRQRILQREPPGWSGLDHLLAEAEVLAGSQPQLDGVHLVVDTARAGPDAIAARIRAERPDLLGG